MPIDSFFDLFEMNFVSSSILENLINLGSEDIVEVYVESTPAPTNTYLNMMLALSSSLSSEIKTRLQYILTRSYYSAYSRNERLV